MVNGKRGVSALLLLVLAVMLGACGGSDSPTALSEDTVLVTGIVTDTAGSPLAGVEVLDENERPLGVSDTEGVFALRVGKDAVPGRVRLRKTGYTSQQARVNVAGAEARFEAVMGHRKPPVRLTNVENGVEYLGEGGARVSIGPDSLVTHDDQGNEVPVTGDVLLSVTPIDVSRNDQLGAFPGPFLGRDLAGNDPAPILSYGTVEYVFATPDGRPVNLASGKYAQIEIPVFITEHLDGTAVQSNTYGQALWYFDETSGDWVQESNAAAVVQSDASPTGLVLQDYVSHFSWWNYDIKPSGSCLQTIRIEGLPSNSNLELTARTVVFSRPRFASTSYKRAVRSVGLVFPQAEIQLRGVGQTAEGLYYAEIPAFVACRSVNGVIDPVNLTFDGPLPPVINTDFPGFPLVFPMFARDAGGQVSIIGNDVYIKFEVFGAERLTIQANPDSDGEILELNPNHVGYRTTITGDTTFRLMAENAAGATTLDIPVTYVNSALPRVSTLSAFYDPASTAFRLRWFARGADQVNYGYVVLGDDPITQGVPVGSTISAPVSPDEDSVLIDIPNDGMPYELFAIFMNSSGQVIRRVPASVSCTGSMANQFIICQDNGEGPPILAAQ